MIAVGALFACRERTVCSPCARREHAAATACAPYTRHGHYKGPFIQSANANASNANTNATF